MANTPEKRNKNEILVKTFLHNQTQELEIKAKQLALQEQEDNHSFEFGKVALATKAEDRKLQREHGLKAQIYTYGLIGFIALLVFAIIFYAMYSDSKAIAMEIIRTIAYLTGGGLGGYGIAKIAETKSTPNDKPKE